MARKLPWKTENSSSTLKAEKKEKKSTPRKRAAPADDDAETRTMKVLPRPKVPRNRGMWKLDSQKARSSD